MASTEQRELELIDKVNLRILTVANDGAKLTALLKTYLPPLLLKAGSEHASVRAKVVLVASRLKTFIRSPDVLLPVGPLLDQYLAHPQHPVVRQLDIGFLQHSIDRVAADERRALVPRLLRGISRDAGNPTAAARWNLFLCALKDVVVPARGSKEDEGFRAALGLDGGEGGADYDAAFVADWLGKLFLLVVAGANNNRRSPGLSEAETTFLTLGKPNETWGSGSSGSLDLAATRIRAVKLLESGAFTDDERFLPAVHAAASHDYRVSSVGEAMLLRNKASLEDEGRVRAMFERHARLPAPYRIRILQLLCKSAMATDARFTEQILAVVKRDIRLTSTTTEQQQQEEGEAKTPDGLQLTKIHKALFEYVNWVARMGPSSSSNSSSKSGEFTVGPTLIELLRGFITEEQGWPRPRQDRRSVNPLDDQNLRARAYETIGVLARGSTMARPQLLELVAWLFRSLAEDPTPEVVVNIEGALSIMTSLFKPDTSSSGDAQELRAIILTYMTLAEGGSAVVRSVRHAAAKWANQCLAFSDPVARWVDILAIAGRSDERTEVTEEGHKGLDPWTYRVNHDHDTTTTTATTLLPDWQALVRTFFQEKIGFGSAMDVDGPPALQNFTGLAAGALPTAVTYCKRILFLSALKDEFKVEPGWERQLETLVTTDKQTRDRIRTYLAGLADDSGLGDLLGASFEGIQEDKSTTEECARAFVDMAALCPASVLAPLAGRGLGRLLAVLRSNKKEVRSLVTRALGMLGAHPAVPVQTFNLVNHVLLQRCGSWRTAVGAEMNAAEGAFLALGYLWSRATYYPHAVASGADSHSSGAVRPCSCSSPSSSHPPPIKRRRTDVGAVAQELTEEAAVVLQDLQQTLLKGQEAPADTTKTTPDEWLPPVKDLGGMQGSLQETIFDTLTQLWTASIIRPDEAAVASYIDVLVPQAKKGNERAITALGRLSIGLEDDNTALDTILPKLYELHELKQAEVHFAIGEAITAAIARWDSDIVQLTVDVESTTTAYRKAKRASNVQDTLQKILTDCKATKPSLLKASGIWLFCIIQHCSHLAEIQARLRECQVAFMRLLSARDELVQETASRGLALVYEKGDPALKQDLVKDLVGAFTGSGTQLKVEEETELFEAGALPTGEGKSVTSYRDIVNLANEVGDQTLVYKFMSLASNAATWSTRSAFGRFGLSSILSESEVDPKLYPKLFRYRFDPNPNVQRSMNDIWKALVKDSNAVMEAHFDAIMADLLKSIHGKEWRVRQASCAAISDLISGRPFQQYEKYYAEIWTKALKVLDDVKGSVREAAMRLCMGMANTLTRQLEEGGASASARDMMASTLPFLLSENGIESSVEEVKGFAITTVITITKTGGSALRPYIATIITQMLGLLSTIEPDAINYYYQRFGDDDRGKIDKLRSQMVSQSPLFQAIENCLRNVDATVMPELAAGLEETINTALGMPTKVGCGRLLVALATRHTTDFAPQYAPRFLKLMERHALDRNDEVSASYARAAAYLLRHAPLAAQERFVARCVALYFAENDDEARREKVAAVVLALSKISPDAVGALEASVLPFAYLGMHDGGGAEGKQSSSVVAKAFREVWEMHGAGSARMATRFVPEIVALATRALDAPLWSLKHAGALAVGSCVRALVTGQTGAGNGRAGGKLVWPVFERALALKTFAGKEKLLDALVDVYTKKAAGMFCDDGDDKEQVVVVEAKLRKIVLREAKRNNEGYRVAAFACLWKCAAAVQQHKDGDDEKGMWEDVVGIVRPFLEAYADGDEEMAVETSAADNDKEKKVARERELVVYKTVLNATEAVARGYSRPAMAKAPAGVLKQVLEVLRPFLRSSKFDSVRREVWYGCVGDLIEDATAAAETSETAAKLATNDDQGLLVAREYFALLDVDKPDEGVETQRLARAKAVKAVVLAVKKGGVFGEAGGDAETRAEMKRILEVGVAGERALDVRQVLNEALAELK